MSYDEELFAAEEHFEKSLESMQRDFQRIRTGRASPAMIDHVQVEAYGSLMRLKEMAGVSVPEPSQLLIKPWDKSSLKSIERALTQAELGMMPQNDGEVIRLNIPPLSDERRRELAAQAKDCCEKCKVAMRNARRDAIKGVEAKAKRDKLPEDLTKDAVDNITELLKTYEGKVEALLKDKVDDLTSL